MNDHPFPSSLLQPFTHRILTSIFEAAGRHPSPHFTDRETEVQRERERFLQVIRHVQGPAWDDLSVGLLLSLVTRCPCWLWMRCTRTCLGWSRTCTGMSLSHTPPTQLLPPSSVEPPLWAPPSTSGVASARGLGGKPLLVQGSA